MNEQTSPEMKEITSAYNYLITNQQSDCRNLVAVIRAQQTGGDCFDLRGAAKVLADYAAKKMALLEEDWDAWQAKSGEQSMEFAALKARVSQQ
jgi:hypothetical protein